MSSNGSRVRGSESGRPVMRLLDVMGKRWTLRILWELRDQRLSFRQLRTRCSDVSPTSLNARLKDLRRLDLVDHTDDGYGYTQWGEELGAQLLELSRWADRWDEATGRDN